MDRICSLSPDTIGDIVKLGLYEYLRTTSLYRIQLEAYETMNEFKNNYPIILVHGFLGWGEDDKRYKVLAYWGVGGSRRLLPYMREKGYEIYAPSLGPITSAWDRACELYAYIFGGTVDYGKVHSEKYQHARFGRHYDGVLKDLGKTEAHKKINLYGHSFGGPTVKAFVDLMCNGWQEEVDGTPETELSPLFKGGMSHLIHSVTTLSGVNNGTVLDQIYDEKSMVAAEYMFLRPISLLGGTKLNTYMDWGMQQFGFSRYPEENRVEKAHVESRKEFEEAFDRYKNSHMDRSNWEMDIIWSKWMNDHQGVSKDVYYFAERADNSHKTKDGTYRPNTLAPFTWWSGMIIGRKQPTRETGYEYGPEWYPNDGYVPVVGQSAPLNQPSVEADRNTEFKPGIWYNMPVRNGDHVVWNGMTGNKWVFFQIYDEMFERTRRLPDAEDVQ